MLRLQIASQQLTKTNLLFVAAASAALGKGASRGLSKFRNRLDWDAFIRENEGTYMLKRHLRMSPDSFQKLLSYI